MKDSIIIGNTGFSKEAVFAMTQDQFVAFCVSNNILTEANASKSYMDIILVAKKKEEDAKKEEKKIASK